MICLPTLVAKKTPINGVSFSANRPESAFRALGGRARTCVAPENASRKSIYQILTNYTQNRRGKPLAALPFFKFSFQNNYIHARNFKMTSKIPFVKYKQDFAIFAPHT